MVGTLPSSLLPPTGFININPHSSSPKEAGSLPIRRALEGLTYGGVTVARASLCNSQHTQGGREPLCAEVSPNTLGGVYPGMPPMVYTQVVYTQVCLPGCITWYI